MTSPGPGFCRSCFTPGPPENCCDRPNPLFHIELFDLSVAHIDCDAFYASIEKRDNPALADQPVIIGGGRRGVVSTACYIARTFGVRSAMPMFKARAACPDAVVIKPNMEKYVTAGRAIRGMMRDLTPLVEPLSIDEAFLDMSGTEKLHNAPPALSLAKLQHRIADEIGVTVSIGLSHNKFLAKIASDLDKPAGYSVIGEGETEQFLAKQPVTKIWGVGRAFAKKLEADGLTKIGQLQGMDEAVLAKRYGEIGLRLARLSWGRDFRAVKPESETKSVSSETTFNEDISDMNVLEDRLWFLCEKVSARMKASGFEGRVVTLKLKSSDFKTKTRRRTLEKPTNFARIAFTTAAALLREAAAGGSWRLIGVGFSTLSPAGNGIESDLFDDDYNKIAAQEDAVDAIREKFGAEAINAGRALRRRDRKDIS